VNFEVVLRLGRDSARMQITTKGRYGIAAVVTVALVAAGAAFAATKIHTTSSVRGPVGGTFRSGGGPAMDGGGYGFPGRGDDGGGGPFDHGGPGGLSAAASYLGLSESALFTQLRSGKTLAQIAASTSGTSTDGLIDAMVAAQRQDLERAVSSGRLSQSQADQLEANLKTRVTAMVNGQFGPRRNGARPGNDNPPTSI
jgi:hypothetical protein